jgi:hypothetical protein
MSSFFERTGSGNITVVGREGCTESHFDLQDVEYLLNRLRRELDSIPPVDSDSGVSASARAGHLVAVLDAYIWRFEAMK